MRSKVEPLRWLPFSNDHRGRGFQTAKGPGSQGARDKGKEGANHKDTLDAQKRRTRDSNPQPVSRRLISSQVPNHSAILRKLVVKLTARVRLFVDPAKSKTVRLKIT